MARHNRRSPEYARQVDAILRGELKGPGLITVNNELRIRDFNKCYTLQETAGLLRISTKTLARLIERGDIKAVQISARRKVVRVGELDRFLNNGANNANGRR